MLLTPGAVLPAVGRVGVVAVARGDEVVLGDVVSEASVGQALVRHLLTVRHHRQQRGVQPQVRPRRRHRRRIAGESFKK